jgi:hypothetical protein
MTQVFLGAFLLSLLHAGIPNHWIPLVAIGRGEGWSRGEMLAATAVAGGAHVLGTIVVGIVVGLVGIGLSSSYRFLMETAAPVTLVGLGLVFLWMDHRGSHHHHEFDVDRAKRRSRAAIVASLSAAMFFSPCIEIEAYYFTAGSGGWPAILGVSAIYLVITLGGMLLLVDLGLKGMERLRWTYLEEHEKQVSGIVLVVLGAAVYLFGLG